MHAHFLVEVKWADPISNVRRFEPLPSSLLRRGFCFRLSEAFVMRKQRRFLKFQVVKRRSSSFRKTKGRFGRSPGYIFVGGEECGYFALEKVGSNPTGACIVPWRRSRKDRRDAGSELESSLSSFAMMMAWPVLDYSPTKPIPIRW